MEIAPLTLAHTHARNAAQETKRSNPVAASEEHDLAAAEFAAAAVSTTDQEALRILRLLEQHHKQLALILKDAHLKPARHTDTNKKDTTTAVDKSSDPSASNPPRLTRTARRDLSGSIASNLASARGIPNQRQRRIAPVSPLISNETADGTFAQDDDTQGQRHTGKSAARPSWAPPEKVTPRVSSESSTVDSPFQQFYSRFEGYISSFTAPLAFTSLPLTPPIASQEGETKAIASQISPRKVQVAPKSEPSPPATDFSHLISDAAFRAVQGAKEPRPHESFLLVPTSGGTMSYADITAANYVDREISRQLQHRRGQSTTSNDDFVDASSQILNHSPMPALLQQSGKGGATATMTYQGKTMEEIVIENETIKKAYNMTAKRLHAFESAAQDRAMAQSMRLLQLSPLTTPENSRGKMVSASGNPQDAGILVVHKRVQELEDALRKNDRRLLKREEENIKLKDTLGKYREKWEGLKAGAKARREQAGGGDRLRRRSSAASVPAAAVNPAKEQAGQE